MDKPVDKRGVIARCIDTIKQLRRKNAKRDAKAPSSVIGKHSKTAAELIKDVEECPICCETKPRAQMLALRSCSHRICLDCLRSYVEVQIEANKVPIVCPQECSKHLELDQCRPHLSAKVANLFVLRLIESRVPESRRIYCPFPKCSAFMVLSTDEKTVATGRSRSRSSAGVSKNGAHSSSANCRECRRSFCVECRVPWHNGISCAVYQTHKKNEDAELYRLAVDRNWRRCQKCKHMVELSLGCYHIFCRCGHQFCYLCGAEWKNKLPTCKCKLWDVENIEYTLRELTAGRE